MSIKSAAPTLYIFAGLPGSGKSTLAQLLAHRVNGAYVRIDTIEHALGDLCGVEVQGEGYALAYRVAEDNLRLGVSVVADSCNPVALTRQAWERVAREAGARPIDIEVICSDRREHRHRVETRASTVEGLQLPTWNEVKRREYHAWTVDRVVVDTARQTPAECLDALVSTLPGLGC